jgi:molecular chaperone GrpE
MSDQTTNRPDERPESQPAEPSAEQQVPDPASAEIAAEAAPMPATDAQPPTGPTAEEHAELKDRLLRALADAENTRRRAEREIDEARRYAVTGFARGLLEVADNLTRALATVPAEERERNEFLKNLVVGIEMTERSLLALFEKNQIRKVAPARGERFDHNRHQAMFEVPTAELPAGSIAEVLQPGYVIADRLLRPAMVGVAKAPANGAAPPAASVDTTV